MANRVSLHLASPDGSNESVLADQAIHLGSPNWSISGAGPFWSPDGTRLAFGFGELHTVSRDGLGLTKVSSPEFAARPQWSPLGKYLAWVEFGPRRRDRWLTVSLADGSIPWRVSGSHMAVSFRWSPDGTRIAFAGAQELDDDLEIFTGAADGTDWKNVSNAMGYDGEVTWPTGSTNVYFTSTRTKALELYAARSDGSGSWVALRSMRIERQVVWSSTGHAFAFTGGRSGTGQRAIWVANRDGSGLRKISGEGEASEPVWAPR
ncbi:MAG: hypothetical protein EXR52_08340 [Dehalococcoidia bacterium]|nr:hypothetical protein [Dehalococcoidia bacterium]